MHKIYPLSPESSRGTRCAHLCDGGSMTKEFFEKVAGNPAQVP
jgi:hypothetical protein